MQNARFYVKEAFFLHKNVFTTHSSNGKMHIPQSYGPFCSFRLLLEQEVQSQFPVVTSLLFPKHISSRKSQPLNKMNQKYYTRVVPQVVPTSAKIINLRRNLSPVKENVTNIREHDTIRGIEKLVNEMLQAEIIRPSSIPYSSPTFC